MFRRAVILFASAMVLATPTVLASHAADAAVADAERILQDPFRAFADAESLAYAYAGDTSSTDGGLDEGFWARFHAERVAEVAALAEDGPEPTVAAAVRVVDAALPVDLLLDPMGDAPAAAAEPIVLRAPAEEPEESVGAETRASGSPAAPAVPAEAVTLAVAAVAAVGWAAGVPAAVWEWARRLGLAAGAFAGYTRLEKDDLLGHEVRNELYARVRDNPGTSLGNLVDGVDTGRNTVVYHLRVLERENLVRSERHGRRRVYYATGGGREVRDEARVQAVLGHETTRAVAEHVRAAPGMDQRQLCEALGLRPSLAHWHVKRLLDAGLVRKERDGRRVRYFPLAEA